MAQELHGRQFHNQSPAFKFRVLNFAFKCSVTIMELILFPQEPKPQKISTIQMNWVILIQGAYFEAQDVSGYQSPYQSKSSYNPSCTFRNTL